jgi:hypothetical protein
MTTLAWDGHTIAVDSFVTGDDSVMDQIDKLFHMDNGELVVGCGRASELHKLFNSLNAGQPVPDGLDISAYHIGKDFMHSYLESATPIVMDMSKKFAQGTGWKWAQAAMDFGFGAVQAIEYACRKDIYTGGKVNYVEVIPRH